ncbi:hypothetical protein [Bacteroides cellulosilyticus]|jgi:hypothetical protein|uniref:hypothetical protein n=1 Tax=Bacteroides cellulosilyticus TaxID=246787 RepID=UPI00204591E2|nr:MAG TPA: hypothetical protein [Caudoviricetes sp.]
MRQKKATRASKRRARKKPEKGFKGLVNRIIRALRRNNTLTVISIVATVLVAAIPFGYTLLKDKKSIKVYIGDFEIKDDAYLALIYLYPTSEVKSSNLVGVLPITYQNNLSNNVENFFSDLSTQLEPIMNAPVLDEINTILKKAPKTEYKKIRFREKVEVLGAERYTFLKGDDAVIRYIIPNFNSQTLFETYEEFTIDTQWFDKSKKEEWGETVVRDYFTIDLFYSYKDIAKSYHSNISIGVVDVNNLDDFVSYIDSSGCFPFYANLINPESGEYVTLNKCILVVPSILYNEYTGGYNMDRQNLKVYEIEYSSKDFYYNRQLTINDGRKKKCISFPDLDVSTPNNDKLLKYVNEKTLEDMRKEQGRD